jgi:K+-transporting ATPase ATPase A chain
MATLVAFVRGFRQRQVEDLGNFWVDLVRTTLYILLPLSLVLALVLVSQGVIQNFDVYRSVPLVQATTATSPVKDADGNPVLDDSGQPKTETSQVTEQVLPMGPAASQIAIKRTAGERPGAQPRAGCDAGPMIVPRPDAPRERRSRRALDAPPPR